MTRGGESLFTITHHAQKYYGTWIDLDMLKVNMFCHFAMKYFTLLIQVYEICTVSEQ